MITDSFTAPPVVLHARVVTGAGGGPEKTIFNSPRFLRNLGYEAVCAYMHPPGDDGFEFLRKRADSTRAELISIPDRGISDWRTVTRLLALCRERNVSIWHGHDYKSNAIGLLLRRWHPMKLVSTVHGWVKQTSRTPLYYGIDRFCLRHYDRVVCVSDELYAECLLAGVSGERCSVIDNAIDLDAIDSTRLAGEARSELLGVPTDRPVLGVVGRLSREKGFDRLIRSADELISAGIPVSLVIAGNGDMASELQRLIGELGRESEIRLMGHQNDPSLVYRAIDVFVMSSLTEGLPNVLLESLAHRLPVVATRVGGIPSVIEDGQNGLLVEPDSVSALTDAVTRILHCETMRDSMSDAGRTTVASRYSFDYRMSRIAAVYDDVLQRDSDLSDSNASGITQNGLPLNRKSEGSLQSTSATLPAGAGFSSTMVAEPVSHPCAKIVQAAATMVELTSNPVGWSDYLDERTQRTFYQQPAWLNVLSRGMHHEPVFLQACRSGQIVGVLPLAFVRSRLFGRFLVSLPYLNSAGVVADDNEAAVRLVGRAISLADKFDVKNLELRHETAVDHPRLQKSVTDKVHMRLTLPESEDDLWNSVGSKVRNQIRKARKDERISISWGRRQLLGEFYDVFCRNMRDLGTPPFGRDLFAAILDTFPTQSEIACVRLDGRTIAAGLLIHGPGVTEVPSASSLRRFNSTNANMLLYWNLLTRSIERGQHTFDFGRSTRDGGTHRFKAQWGAEESPAVWQHYVRNGDASDLRPSSGRFDLLIRTWQRLPVWLTRLVGPSIVRGIP